MRDAIRLAAMVMTMAVVATQANAEDFEILEIEHEYVKWGEPRMGTGAVVTYAFATELRRFPNARNCAAIKPLKLASRKGRIPGKEILQAFAEAADEWSRVAAVKFVRAEPGRGADLTIGAQVIPVGRAFANVTPADSHVAEGALETASTDDSRQTARKGPGKPASLRTLRQAQICLNAALPWKTEFDGDLETYDLKYTFLHEIGHVLGLDHAASADTVMNFRYRETVSSLQRGDIAGVSLLYGPPRRGFSPALAK